MQALPAIDPARAAAGFERMYPMTLEGLDGAMRELVR
jgi:uncharacterized protein with von Willebrand factor type A (vWA) domain